MILGASVQSDLTLLQRHSATQYVLVLHDLDGWKSYDIDAPLLEHHYAADHEFRAVRQRVPRRTLDRHL